VWQVGLLRAGAWTARGLRVPARNALLADVVPPAAYGFERAMDNLGAIIGPLLALGLVVTRAAIAMSVVPGLLAAVAIVYAIRHTATPTGDVRPGRVAITSPKSAGGPQLARRVVSVVHDHERVLVSSTDTAAGI
jgi:MFS family permease